MTCHTNIIRNFGISIRRGACRECPYRLCGRL